VAHDVGTLARGDPPKPPRLVAGLDGIRRGLLVTCAQGCRHLLNARSARKNFSSALGGRHLGWFGSSDVALVPIGGTGEA